MQTISRTDKFYAITCRIHSLVPKRDQLYLAEEIQVELFDGNRVRIPAGFLTDFHSVPPWLWSLWPPFNAKTNLAALVHDYLYENWDEFAIGKALVHIEAYGQERHYADHAFLQLMDQFSPKTRTRNYLYYLGVRLGGWWNWNEFRKANTIR